MNHARDRRASGFQDLPRATKSWLYKSIKMVKRALNTAATAKILTSVACAHVYQGQMHSQILRLIPASYKIHGGEYPIPLPLDT